MRQRRGSREYTRVSEEPCWGALAERLVGTDVVVGVLPALQVGRVSRTPPGQIADLVELLGVGALCRFD